MESTSHLTTEEELTIEELLQSDSDEETNNDETVDNNDEIISINNEFINISDEIINIDDEIININNDSDLEEEHEDDDNDDPIFHDEEARINAIILNHQLMEQQYNIDHPPDLEWEERTRKCNHCNRIYRNADVHETCDVMDCPVDCFDNWGDYLKHMLRNHNFNDL